MLQVRQSPKLLEPNFGDSVHEHEENLGLHYKPIKTPYFSRCSFLIEPVRYLLTMLSVTSDLRSLR